MSSILDIDLDYFNLIENPEQRLQELLDWGDCPIALLLKSITKSILVGKTALKEEL